MSLGPVVVCRVLGPDLIKSVDRVVCFLFTILIDRVSRFYIMTRGPSQRTNLLGMVGVGAVEGL